MKDDTVYKKGNFPTPTWDLKGLCICFVFECISWCIRYFEEMHS